VPPEVPVPLVAPPDPLEVADAVVVVPALVVD
jgi:hypothetical protein